MSFRLSAYRRVLRLIEKPVERKRFGRKRLSLPTSMLSVLGEIIPQSRATRAWFHASSFGELEILWPAISEWACGAPDRAIVLTVFSTSAETALVRLVDELKAAGACVLFAGYSPWEGNWENFLRVVRPMFFVTAKYEAWPELWIGLQRTNTPLVIVGAMERKSLKTALSICKLLGASLPPMLLLPAAKPAAERLEPLFPNAEVIVCGEPRWDRVSERTRKGNPRASELIELARGCPRPWMVLGSVWDEDLEVWKEHLSRAKGTFWVVPHRVDAETVGKIGARLRSAGLEPKLSSKAGPSFSGKVNAGTCWLVDEMGFLSELYKAADFAFVGGGFGKGVHSTIEPALHGIPVGIGPNGTERFPEISELKEVGQLTVVHNSEELRQWSRRASELHPAQLQEWKDLARRRLGATAKVLVAIQDFVTRRDNVVG